MHLYRYRYYSLVLVFRVLYTPVPLGRATNSKTALGRIENQTGPRWRRSARLREFRGFPIIIKFHLTRNTHVMFRRTLKLKVVRDCVLYNIDASARAVRMETRLPRISFSLQKVILHSRHCMIQYIIHISGRRYAIL